MKSPEVFNDGRKGKVLVFVLRDGNSGFKEVLMGYHVKQEHMNFPGGGIEAGETAREAAIREVKEETSLKVINIREVGNMIFEFPQGLGVDLKIFIADEWSGDLREEGDGNGLENLNWYSLDDLPRDQMWPTDLDWIDYAWRDEYFKGHLVFDENGEGHDLAITLNNEIKGV